MKHLEDKKQSYFEVWELLFIVEPLCVEVTWASVQGIDSLKLSTDSRELIQDSGILHSREEEIIHLKSIEDLSELT